MKKNVLLVTSAAPERSSFYTREKRFPLGVGFLIAVLRSAGHEVHFIDNYLMPSSFLEDGYLARHAIDYVGIYANTICFRDTLRMITAADRLRRQGLWNGKIVVGGPHASLFPDSIPDAADFIVIGEGERAICDIVEERVHERIVHSVPIPDLDVLPLPAYDYFQHPRYWKRVDPVPDQPIYTMNTSRGCPFRCRFCSVKGIWGRTYRTFSPERVVADIEQLQAQYGIKGVYFREDNFTLDRERLHAFCELLLRRNIAIAWFAESRVTDVTRESAALMKRSGCRWLYLGCESGSQRVLDYFHKGITVEDIRSALAICKHAGIHAYTSWVVGAPTETEDELAMTLSLIQELQPEQAATIVFVGLPGSELYEEMKTSGELLGYDDVGLAYTKKFNALVQRFYGDGAAMFQVDPRQLHAHPLFPVCGKGLQ